MIKYLILNLIIVLFIGCGGDSGGETTTETTINPKVSSVVSKSGALPTASSIEITFDKSMNVSTLTNINITLKVGSSAQGTFSQTSSTKVSFTGIDISSDKTFVLTISTSVQDSDNTSLKSTYTKTFYSKAEAIYAEVTSSYSSKVWLDRNLGAKQVCTAYNDSDCYGNYYQWGRSNDGHEKGNSTKYAVDTSAAKPYANDIDVDNGDLWYSKFIAYDIGDTNSNDWLITDDGTTRNTNWIKSDGSSICPVGYRVPSKTEIETELGLESNSGANITSREAAFNSFLKLPIPGSRTSAGNLGNQGNFGFLWSSSINSGNTAYSSSAYFNASAQGWSIGTQRGTGLAVRCIKN